MVGAALVMLPLAACGMNAGGDDSPGIPGSGSGGTRTYAAANFSKVELAGSDDVDVTIGTAFAVRAEGAAEDLDKLRIRVRGDTLSVDRRPQKGMSWGGHKVTVHVTVPRLAAVDLAGSGTLTAARVTGDRFSGDIAGSGNLVLRQVAVGDADFDIAGSGKVVATGTARALSIDIAGSGGLDAAGLRASGAKVSIAGSGDVRATVAGEAKVSIMGSGNVDLGREARCTTEQMGSGSVRCG